MWRHHRLQVVFVVGILLLGVVLVIFSTRALLQERRWADQQVRERLQRVADLAVDGLEEELRLWQQALEEIGATPTDATTSWPERVRRAVEGTDSAVVVYSVGDDARVIPPGRLLYELTPAISDSLISSISAGVPEGLAEAEFAELSEKDYRRAIQRYESLLASAEPSHRPLLLHWPAPRGKPDFGTTPFVTTASSRWRGRA